MNLYALEICQCPPVVGGGHRQLPKLLNLIRQFFSNQYQLCCYGQRVNLREVHPPTHSLQNSVWGGMVGKNQFICE